MSDDIYERAKEIAKRKNSVATSLFQRELRIGYAAAAAIVKRMEEEGFCEPFNPERPRRLL